MSSPDTQSQEGETPGQKSARLRRERREAKIKEGGSARLDKITNVSGRQTLPEPPPATTLSAHNNDPEEVDLSTHPSAARTPTKNGNSNNQPTEDEIRALLRGAGPQSGADQGQQQQQGNEDPMMKMLQQLMGGMPGAENGEGGGGGLPPGLEAMLGAGGMAGIPGMGSPKQQPQDKYAYLWKIVHAVFALLLGIYVTAKSHAFNGDVSRGGIDGAGHEGGVNVFWAFATAELVLQSSRFFSERGHSSQLGGWMGIAGNMLPEPYKSWVRLAGRYSGIWSTIVEDGMVVVFVLGVVAWWKGAVG